MSLLPVSSPLSLDRVRESTPSPSSDEEAARALEALMWPHDLDSVVSGSSLEKLRERYHIPEEFVLVAPDPGQRSYDPIPRGFALTQDALEAGSVEAEPLATITESQVQRFVRRNLVTRFGLPRSIVTDNGPQFAGRRFQEFCAKHKIQLRFSSVAYPQANGLAEVTNRSIIDGLKRRVSAARSACIDELPSVLWALRTTLKTPTGESPDSLTFGTEAVLPSEVAVPTPRTAGYGEEASGEGLRSNLDLLEERRADAHRKSLSYKTAVARVYNRKVRPRSIKLEDLVLRKVEVSHPTRVRGKLAPKWEGPYRVIECPDQGRSDSQQWKATP
ncbi:uncharacterized protein LOC135613430 [Musa acuminata AAA Group]|uniref:uncharacterized protein LOC135613420 n=1 Tax=Musa acuminata AAA Group TaxID=214697 RepID=UPI0031D29575